MTLLIMAAGSGSRYGTLKQFDGLGPQGAFLMEYSIFDAIEAGFKQFVIITQATQISFVNNYLKKRLPQGISFKVLAQELEDLPKSMKVPQNRKKPWGTAHAVWTARQHISEGFAIINADDFYGREAFLKAAQFLKTYRDPTDFALISYPLHTTLSEHGAVSRGICHIENQFLMAIEEHTKIAEKEGAIIDIDSGQHYSGKEATSMNFWICKPSFFEAVRTQLQSFMQQKGALHKKELYIPMVIATLLADKKIRVRCIPSNSKWFGVTYLADRANTVEKLLKMTLENTYPVELWKKK